jgi:hypothetical protein
MQSKASTKYLKHFKEQSLLGYIAKKTLTKKIVICIPQPFSPLSNMKSSSILSNS